MLSHHSRRSCAARRWLPQSARSASSYPVSRILFCFPYDRAKDFAIAWAATQGYDVTIGSAGPGFGFAVNFKDIRVRSRPTGTGKPIRFSLDSARVRVSPFVIAQRNVFVARTRRRGWAASSASISSARRRVRCTSPSTRMRSTCRSYRACARRSTCRSPGRSRCRWTWRRRPTRYSERRRYAVRSRMQELRDRRREDCRAEDRGQSAAVPGGLTLPRVRLGDPPGRARVDR